MFNDRNRAIVVLALAIGQVATTFWPLTGLGESAQMRSDAWPTPLVPIGWTFAIWGVIYLGATAYAIWQFLPQNREHKFNRAVGWLIAYMYLVNTTWQVWVSMVGLGLVDWIVLASEAVVGTIVLFRINQLGKMGWGVMLAGSVPVALLTGWTTAASFVGSTVSAAAMGMFWGIDAAIGWWILTVAITVGVVLGLAHRHATYALAIAWASWGLYNNAQIKNLDYIAGLAIIGVIAMVAVAVISDVWKLVIQPRLNA